MTKEPELPEDLCRRAAAFADTAVISLCRFSGEGWDRKSKYDERMDESAVVIAGNTTVASSGTKETFPKGDFYLTEEEEKMIGPVPRHLPVRKIPYLPLAGNIPQTPRFSVCRPFLIQCGG